MATQLEKINLVRGDELVLVLTFTEDEVAYPLSTYTNIVCDFRERQSEASNLIASCEISDGILIDENTITLTLDSDETKSFDEGIYHYDLRFLIGDVVETHLYGQIEITQNTTAI